MRRLPGTAATSRAICSPRGSLPRVPRSSKPRGLGGAPEEIVGLLGTLAPRATFTTVGEVWRAVGGAAEVRSPEAAGPVASAEPEPVPTFEARTTGTGAPPLGVTPSPETVDGGPGLVLEAFHLAQLAIGLGLVPLRIGRAVAREILHRFRPHH